MLALVIGGSGSGKSALAEGLMVAFAAEKRYYLATMAVADDESRKRVQRHRNMRQGKGFETIECPVGLKQLTLPQTGDVLLECMSNLAANEIFMPEGSGREACAQILEGVKVLQKQCRNLVIVTNNVFEDGMIYDRETENYLSILAEINCQLAAEADLVLEAVTGIPLVLKGVLPENLSLTQENEKMGMIFVTGGRGQGKLSWALQKLQLSNNDSSIYQGELGWPDSLEGIRVIDNIQELVKAGLLQGKTLDDLCQLLIRPDLILLMDEVGCGLVPIDPMERQYREMVGRLGEQLALHAEEVYRMSCGIAQKLK